MRNRTAALAAALAFTGLGVAAPLIALPGAAYAAVAEKDVQGLLASTIADLQNGTPKYETMGDDLANAVKTQLPAMSGGLKSLGAAKTFVRQGDTTQPYVYAVTFESGMTLTWRISVADDGKIIGLLVQ